MKELLTNGSTINIVSPKQSDAPTKYLLYFHGGGLVYGSKNDLPTALLNIFVNKGYTVITLDYLLAPNATLVEIRQGLIESFEEIKHRYIQTHAYILCGRSAGSYLAILLLHYLIESKQPLPERFINFYGYNNLDFLLESRQLGETLITTEMIQRIDTEAVIWDDPLLARYILYVYAVQNNLMLEYLDVSSEEIERYAVGEEYLEQFPPSFHSASSGDLDVPFKYSRKLAKQIPQSVFVPVYYLEHDFLKLSEDLQVQQVLEELNNWL